MKWKIIVLVTLLSDILPAQQIDSAMNSKIELIIQLEQLKVDAKMYQLDSTEAAILGIQKGLRTEIISDMRKVVREDLRKQKKRSFKK